MPGIDPELVLPISEISEILQKRPGLVSIEGIKRLSNLYGFETFSDIINGTGASPSVMSPPTRASSLHPDSVERLSLSGKIILIDIDFQDGKVSTVSLSSAVTIKQLPGADEALNFINTANSPNVETILFQNLQCRTLDSFNRNLRILSQLDRLSMPSPHDLFNFFNQLAYNLDKVRQYQVAQARDLSLKTDLEEGCAGIGKVVVNHDGKVGVFLKYWETNRDIRRWLEQSGYREEYPNEQCYIHFKFMENTKELQLDEETMEPTEGYPDIWFDEGNWLLTPRDKVEIMNVNLVLELLPCVWVPLSLISQWDTVRYEAIANDNSNDYNNERILTDSNPVDKLFSAMNSSIHKFYKVDGRKLQVSMIMGSQFVKLHKLMISDITQLQAIADDLRNYCMLSSILRRLLARAYEDDEEVALTEIRLSDLMQPETAARRPSTLVVTNPKKNLVKLTVDSKRTFTISSGKVNSKELAVSEDLYLAHAFV